VIAIFRAATRSGAIWKSGSRGDQLWQMRSSLPGLPGTIYLPPGNPAWVGRTKAPDGDINEQD